MRTEAPATRPPRLPSATSGSVAVEFALIVPVLISLYLGCIDLTTGFTSYRKFQHATSVMSDLVTRANSLSKSDLQSIIAIGDGVLAPRATKLDSTKITVINVDSAGKATVGWSLAKEDKDKDATGSAITLPANLAGMKNTSLVRTVTSYTYRPPVGSNVIGNLTWQKQLYSQTRTGSTVACTDC